MSSSRSAISSCDQTLAGSSPVGRWCSANPIRSPARTMMRPRDRRSVDSQLDRRGQPKRLGAAASGDPAVDRGQERVDQAVLGARGELDFHLDLSLETRQLAQEQVGRSLADARGPGSSGPRLSASVSVTAPLGARTSSPAPSIAPRTPLTPWCRRQAGSTNGRPASSRIRANVDGRSNRGKHNQSTEPARAHQRRRVTVGQQGVIGDRRRAHDPIVTSPGQALQPDGALGCNGPVSGRTDLGMMRRFEVLLPSQFNDGADVAETCMDC